MQCHRNCWNCLKSGQNLSEPGYTQAVGHQDKDDGWRSSVFHLSSNFTHQGILARLVSGRDAFVYLWLENIPVHNDSSITVLIYRCSCFLAACLSSPLSQKLFPSSPISSQTSSVASITRSTCWAGMKERQCSIKVSTLLSLTNPGSGILISTSQGNTIWESPWAVLGVQVACSTLLCYISLSYG